MHKSQWEYKGKDTSLNFWHLLFMPVASTSYKVAKEQEIEWEQKKKLKVIDGFD